MKTLEIDLQTFWVVCQKADGTRFTVTVEAAGAGDALEIAEEVWPEGTALEAVRPPSCGFNGCPR